MILELDGERFCVSEYLAVEHPFLQVLDEVSGFIQARMLPSRTTPDLFGGMWS